MLNCKWIITWKDVADIAILSSVSHKFRSKFASDSFRGTIVMESLVLRIVRLTWTVVLMSGIRRVSTDTDSSVIATRISALYNINKNTEIHM